MNILLIGNGGRENALAWKIFNSPSFRNNNGKLYNTTGNPGINQFAEPVEIKEYDLKSLITFALKAKIDFTVVGPEIPLSKGIVNKFEREGLKIFGPAREAALIESSKSFAKNLMLQANIPTARFKTFSKNNIKEAEQHLKRIDYPAVIKADGLAAGKGVVIAKDFKVAWETVNDFCFNGRCGDSGINFIIEDFMEGEEVSVFVITDGEDYKVLPYSQDYKKIYDGDMGKNTGGMGSIAPLKKFMNIVLEEKIKSRIIEPVLKALMQMNRKFKGCLYCGLMIVNNEPFVVEFNCRFGDPETQAVLPLIESDFLELLLASSENQIKNYNLEINNDYACCVVMASGGYPDNYDREKEITGFENINRYSLVFHSGTRVSEGKILSYGGRVLSVVGISQTSLIEAVKNAYESISKISFAGKYFRKDIGYRQFISNSKEELAN